MATAATDLATDFNTLCEALARQARTAARHLAQASAIQKNRWLLACAEILQQRQQDILAANEKDVRAAAAQGLTAATIDRLTLNPQRLAALADSLRQIAALPDPVGEIREVTQRPNGLSVFKVGVPLGVIFFIYESRPNVTVDAAALCVKSGNAVILRGGSEAFHTNTLFHELLSAQLAHHGLPPHGVQLVPTTARDAVGTLLRMKEWIDLVIPRGGKSLIQRVSSEATMPVLKHFDGVCHVYVDAAADLQMAEHIVINAKCQRPATCNAAECLLVHRSIAAVFLPQIGKRLLSEGVELRGCPETCQLIPAAKAATTEDYRTEYLDWILSVKVVSHLDEAIDHIHTFGSHHTDAIITNDMRTAREFARRVDSAAVMINASTRFHDGYEFGLGAEIGISTDRFHARGPCGLRELTTYKYIVEGCGHIRE